MKTIKTEKLEAVIRRFFKNASDFASQSGVAQSSISKTLSGAQELNIKALSYILTSLRVDPDWLFSDDEDLEVRRRGDKDDFMKKYYEALEENASLLREKAEWFQERDAKKNHPKLPDEQ